MMDVDGDGQGEVGGGDEKKNATIEKLVIQGIRAFSPKFPQTIEFYSPLTMIVGQNGCGKTTIIECLKYITTGTMPPGTKNGHSFINDPGMTDTADVRASIKLRFVNTQGHTCVTARTMSLTKKGGKAGKVEFKSLDGTLKTTTLDNKKVSTTMKCTDLDQVISNSLGVTAAILENVIFCHQEESNWPMLESQLLKKKLDDIFESTRYTKALEAFLKAKKSFQAKAKEAKSTQKELAAHLHAAESFQRDQEGCQSSITSCDEELEALKEKVEAAADRASRFKDNINRMDASKEELSKLQWKVDEGSRRVAEREKSLEKEYTESDNSLQELLEDFDAKMQRKETERRDLQRNIDGLTSDNNKMREEIDDLNIKKGISDSLQDHFKTTEAKFNELTKTACQKYELQRPNVRSTEREGGVYRHNVAKEFLNALNSRIAAVAADNDENVNHLKKITADADKAVGEVRERSQRLDLELESKVKEINKITQDIALKQNSISSTAVSRENINSLERDFAEKKAELDHFESTNNAKVTDFKTRIKEATDQIRDLTEDIYRDADVLAGLSLRRNELLEAEASMKQINSDLEQVLTDAGQLYRNHSESLNDAIAPANPDGIDAHLQSLAERIDEWRTQLSAKKRESDDEIRRKATADALLNDLRKKLTDEKANLALYNNAAQDFETLAGDIQGLVAQLNVNKATSRKIFQNVKEHVTTSDEAVEALTAAYNFLGFCSGEKQLQANTMETAQNRSATILETEDFQSKYAEFKHACPCCRKGATEAEMPLIEKALRKFFKPEFASIKEEDIISTTKTTDALMERVREIDGPVRKLTLARNLIKEYEAKIRTLESENSPALLLSQTNRLRSEVSKLESQISAGDKAHSILNELKIRWRGIASRKVEIDGRMNSIQNSQFGGDAGGRKIDVIEQQQAERSKKKESLQNDKDKLSRDESEHTKKHYMLKTVLQEKEKSLGEARKKGEKHAEDAKALTDLQQRRDEAEKAKRIITAERDETARHRTDQERNRNTARLKYEDGMAVNRTRADEARNLRDQIQQLIDAMNETNNKLSSDEIRNSESRIEEMQQRIAKNTQDIGLYSPQISAINSDLMNQEHTKRVVRDNLDLRKVRKDLEATKLAMKTLREKKGLDDAVYTEALRDHQRAEQERGKYTEATSVLRGKIEIYHQQLREIKAKLNQSAYKNVQIKHRRISIEYETIELAVKDLDSYYNALDKALQNYHQLKIAEINKIIRELWQLIYKGQDIDVIRLESGEDDGAASRATRSYNYRVVMEKGETPLDMRGRCSAGQRVLAAIVIRLALAETFCLNCGILALDEPTTNLDEPNKAGLAHALARIIISRSAQQNFQLIIITHDEDFVKLMNAELSSNPDFSLPDYYFKITREESEDYANKHFSSISRIAWGDN